VWTFIAIAVSVILGLWALAAVGYALIRMGIREYFRQKRIHYLEMLQHAPEEQEHK